VRASESRTSVPIARLPGRLHTALVPFRQVTGLTAVASLAMPAAGGGRSLTLSPPFHPRCARRLRSLHAAPPCRHEWSIHLRGGRRSPGVQSHSCPVGLRCACVPIRFDHDLVGIVKVVAGSETSPRDFSAATRLLTLLVSGVTHESVVSMLAERVTSLRASVAELRDTRWGDSRVNSTDALTTGGNGVERGGEHGLVGAALSHLQRHYKAPDLSLLSVARALGCNPRYLTTRFTLAIGEHMHTHLVRLRVSHACRLLADTGGPVKEVAFSSGFRNSTSLARAFKRQVGVSPSEYRRVFREA
jgi:AraC-like DNA-binding protein